MKAIFNFRQQGAKYSAIVDKAVGINYEGKFSPKKFANEALPYVEAYLKSSPMIRRNMGATLSIQIVEGDEILYESKAERKVLMRDSQTDGAQESNRKHIREALKWLAIDLS